MYFMHFMLFLLMISYILGFFQMFFVNFHFYFGSKYVSKSQPNRVLAGIATLADVPTSSVYIFRQSKKMNEILCQAWLRGLLPSPSKQPPLE